MILPKKLSKRLLDLFPLTQHEYNKQLPPVLINRIRPSNFNQGTTATCGYYTLAAIEILITMQQQLTYQTMHDAVQNKIIAFDPNVMLPRLVNAIKTTLLHASIYFTNIQEQQELDAAILLSTQQDSSILEQQPTMEILHNNSTDHVPNYNGQEFVFDDASSFDTLFTAPNNKNVDDDGDSFFDQDNLLPEPGDNNNTSTGYNPFPFDDDLDDL
jgi:hypothetical protein